MAKRSLPGRPTWLQKMAYLAAGLMLLSGAVLGYQVYSHLDASSTADQPEIVSHLTENRLEPAK
jgi:hypothetical protein